MSHGLAPSKSTVYVSNLPYELKNNDIHKILEKYGKIVKVTIVKDKETRRSKGIAFVLFLNREDAKKCVEETNLKQVSFSNLFSVFGRTLKSSIANDNGRSAEFIKRKNYPDKSCCFECGEAGHLSYKCEKNLLGEREPPPKKVRKRRKKKVDASQDDDDYGNSSEEEGDRKNKDYETLSAAIALEQEKRELENYRYKVATGNYGEEEMRSTSRKRIKTSNYFSDEEESE